MAQQTLDAWPDGLAVQLTRRRPTDLPELTFNQPLPLEVTLPTWLASSFNMALSFLMRSAIMLHFMPHPGPTVLAAREETMLADIEKAERAVHIVLTERAVHVVEPGTGRPSAIHAFSYALFEPFCRQLCEGPIHSATEPGSVGFACRKAHLDHFIFTLKQQGGFVYILFAQLPLLLLSSMLACAWLFAFAEACLATALVLLPLVLIIRFLPLPMRPLPLSRAVAIAMLAQTIPTAINAFLEGPLHHGLQSAAFGDGGAALADKQESSLSLWALDGVEPLTIPHTLFFLLHLAIATYLAVHASMEPLVDEARRNALQLLEQLREAAARARVEVPPPGPAERAARAERDAARAAEQQQQQQQQPQQPQPPPQQHQPPQPTPPASQQQPAPQQGPPQQGGHAPSHVARAHAPWLPAGSVVSTPPLVATVQLNTGMYWTYVEEAPPLKEARLHAACAQLSASTQLNAQKQLEFLQDLQLRAHKWQ